MHATISEININAWQNKKWKKVQNVKEKKQKQKKTHKAIAKVKRKGQKQKVKSGVCSQVLHLVSNPFDPS